MMRTVINTRNLAAILLLVGCGIGLQAQAPESGPILQLDTQGHTGVIKDILVTGDGEIVSASADKTIRVWDSRSGREKRWILGEIGPGNEGKVLSIALSGDGRYLAAAGYLAGSRDAIRIYHYASGELLQVLKGHRNVVLDLAFSDDDRYLVSGSFDDTIRIWDTESWELLTTIEHHEDAVYAVLMVRNRNLEYDIYSSSLDRSIAHHVFSREGVSFQKDYDAGHRIQYLATNGEHVAAAGAGGREVLVLSRGLRVLQTIDTGHSPAGLSYSPDGRRLLTGSASPPYSAVVYTAPDYAKEISFDKHTNLTRAVAFLDDRRAVTGGGDNMEIYLWDTGSGESFRQIIGLGKSVWSVGIRGDEIAWGSEYTGPAGGSDLQYAFSLADFSVRELTEDEEFNRIETETDGLTLEHGPGGDYGYSDAVLVISGEDGESAQLVRTTTDGYAHSAYGWYRDSIISGGGNGQLNIYGTDGEEIASLVGHTGDIWSLALEGDTLVTGSADQTIRIWNLKDLDDGRRILTPMLNLFVSAENEYALWSQSGYFASSGGGIRHVGYHVNAGTEKEARYVSSDRYYDTLYRPDIVKEIWTAGTEDEAIANIGE